MRHFQLVRVLTTVLYVVFAPASFFAFFPFAPFDVTATFTRFWVVTFTSASAVRNFVKVVGAEPAADLLRTTVVACIGPVTAEAAALSHIETTVVPAHYTVRALVDAIVEHFEKRAVVETTP